jgi:hypothetical protein
MSPLVFFVPEYQSGTPELHRPEIADGQEGNCNFLARNEIPHSNGKKAGIAKE